MSSSGMGLYYEDFEEGLCHETPSRTITEADVVAFAGMSGDFNPLHTDEEFAKQTVFGTRVAHGLLGVAVTSGLLSRLALFDGTGIAFLHLEWDFHIPIRFGDTLHVRQTVLSRRPTREASRGIVEFGINLVNQHGDTVQSGVRRLMIARSADLAR